MVNPSADEGTIIGTTKRALGQRPGEKSIMYFAGAVEHGYNVWTYFSSVTTYFAQARKEAAAGANEAYVVNVYAVGGLDGAYKKVYLSIYGTSTGQTGANASVPVSVLIVGER